MDFGITKINGVAYKDVIENLDWIRIQEKMI
jgi:hypothetical protein